MPHMMAFVFLWKSCFVSLLGAVIAGADDSFFLSGRGDCCSGKEGVTILEEYTKLYVAILPCKIHKEQVRKDITAFH